ncbi:MAG TPA: hypothetical protein VI168_00835 [Croceibacterium sp.]
MSESPLDPFHRHEVLHAAQMVRSMFDEFVEQHPFTQADAELREGALKASEALGEFYQLVGRKTL